MKRLTYVGALGNNTDPTDGGEPRNRFEKREVDNLVQINKGNIDGIIDRVVDLKPKEVSDEPKKPDKPVAVPLILSPAAPTDDENIIVDVDRANHIATKVLEGFHALFANADNKNRIRDEHNPNKLYWSAEVTRGGVGVMVSVVEDYSPFPENSGPEGICVSARLYLAVAKPVPAQDAAAGLGGNASMDASQQPSA